MPKEKIMDLRQFGGIRKVRITCQCDEDEMEQKKQARLASEKIGRIKRLRSLSLIGKRYEKVTFDSTTTGINATFDVAFKRCQKYCEVWKEVLHDGLGIYLFGNKGVGKTHLTACIANELISHCVPVLLTNLFELSKAIKATYHGKSEETEQGLIHKFTHIDFLFFDDLGTEIFTKNENDTWQQTLLFDVINRRYNAKKPTIFSSNYSLNELVNVRGVAEKTIDRISEMTKGAVIRIAGNSWRKQQQEVTLF